LTALFVLFALYERSGLEFAQLHDWFNFLFLGCFADAGSCVLGLGAQDQGFFLWGLHLPLNLWLLLEIEELEWINFKLTVID
jgi:hypothetical protein